MTGRLSLLLALVFAVMAAANGRSQDAELDDKAIRVQVVTRKFFDLLFDRKIDEAKQYLAANRDRRTAERVESILSRFANQKVRVFDARVEGDVAMVLTGREGTQFRDGIDIDPVVLIHQDDQWRILVTISADALLNRELTDGPQRNRAKSLLKWYERREPEVRAAWRED